MINYIQVDILCTVIVIIVYFFTKGENKIISNAQKALRNLIFSEIILCISDMTAYYYRGTHFLLSRAILYLSNSMYIEMILASSVFWFLYAVSKTETSLSKNTVRLLYIPFWVFTALMIVNVWTGIIFTIDSNNLYSRGSGVVIHWIASMIYMTGGVAVAFRKIMSTQSPLQKAEYRPLLMYAVAPLVTSMIQMTSYGISSLTCGITISIVLITFSFQSNQIRLDELTGIKNRKSLRHYIEDHFDKGELTFFMMDLNRFKMINDVYGHYVGDLTLQAVAKSIRKTCGSFSEKLYFCRYGGDEFLIIGEDISETSAKKVEEALRKGVAEIVIDELKGTQLETSVGIAVGKCSNIQEYTALLEKADKSMYEDKQRLKAMRNN